MGGDRFEKRRGRPRENPIQRRLEIFEAVTPLIDKYGGDQLTMAQAARAAHVSVGTLYHYFSSKQALVTYGLNPEAVPLYCARLGDGGPLEVDAVVELIIRNLRIMRPSLNAAIELGVPAVRNRVEVVVKQPIPAFTALLARCLSDDDTRDVADVERIVRRSIGSALMEQHFRPDELRRHFKGLLQKQPG